LGTARKEGGSFRAAKTPSPSAASGDGTKTATPSKKRKLSFKETRELDGMEAQIHIVEAEVTRIEGLFADPEFFRKHASQVNQLTHELDAAKARLPQLYARWEELEAIRVAAAC
jgi:ATP-binding cassette subfamily F protein uup